MAKNYTPKPKKEAAPIYPSSCGSHKVMIDERLTNLLTVKEYTDEYERVQTLVVCRDSRGAYLTRESVLDNKMADRYRDPSDDWRHDKLTSHLPEGTDLSEIKEEPVEA